MGCFACHAQQHKTASSMCCFNKCVKNAVLEIYGASRLPYFRKPLARLKRSSGFTRQYAFFLKPFSCFTYKPGVHWTPAESSTSVTFDWTSKSGTLTNQVVGSGSDVRMTFFSTWKWNRLKSDHEGERNKSGLFPAGMIWHQVPHISEYIEESSRRTDISHEPLQLDGGRAR